MRSGRSCFEIELQAQNALWLIRLRSRNCSRLCGSEDFPLLLETWRTCLEDEFDLENLKSVLEELRNRVIHVSETVTRSASPFAGHLVWKQTNKYMYEDDTPLLARESALRPDLIKELLFSSHLRPKIPTELIRVLDEKLKRTAPGYPPGSALELLDWVKERVLIPEPEWKELAAAIRRDYDADAQSGSGRTERSLPGSPGRASGIRFSAAWKRSPKCLLPSASSLTISRWSRFLARRMQGPLSAESGPFSVRRPRPLRRLRSMIFPHFFLLGWPSTAQWKRKA
jgi:hypothetical protein